MKTENRKCLLTLAFGLLGSLPFAANAADRSDLIADRFVANGDEVTDRLTGLIWRRCSEGQTWTGSTCKGKVTSFTWEEALDHARQVATGGVPWRLPNVKELASLVDDTRLSPAIDTASFPRTPDNGYWSSTYYAGYAENARWGVKFDDGLVADGRRYSMDAVRLVRTPGP